jgi:hypothetical protein
LADFTIRPPAVAAHMASTAPTPITRDRDQFMN